MVAIQTRQFDQPIVVGFLPYQAGAGRYKRPHLGRLKRVRRKRPENGAVSDGPETGPSANGLENGPVGKRPGDGPVCNGPRRARRKTA